MKKCIQQCLKEIRRWWHWRQLRQIHGSADKAMKRANRQHAAMRKHMDKAHRYTDRGARMLG